MYRTPLQPHDTTSTTPSASIRVLAIARRGGFTRKACGYVDDRHCRPAALPPLPERTRKAANAAFADIPTGATANKGFDIDEVKGRIAEPANAMTAIGATSKPAGRHLKKLLRLSHDWGLPQTAPKTTRCSPPCRRRSSLALRRAEQRNGFAPTFHYAAEEVAAGRPASETVLAKLSELLFVERCGDMWRICPDGQTGWGTSPGYVYTQRCACSGAATRREEGGRRGA